MGNKEVPHLNRDLSWLSFNYRVLQEAKDEYVPLLERIKFLGIYSSNLDEFFRVRVASIRGLKRLSRKTQSLMNFTPEELLQEISEVVNKQQEEFTHIFQRQILPELKAQGVHIVRLHELSESNRQFLENLYRTDLIQYLQPILIVKHKIRTFLVNNALYLAVVLQTKGQSNRYALVRVPSHKIARFIELPSDNPDRRELIILDDVVRHFLRELFPGYHVAESYSIKMTRDAELHIEDEYTGNLIDKIKKGLSKRNIGPGTRFVYDRKMPDNCLDFLMEALEIAEEDLHKEGRYHNNFDLLKFPDFGLNQLKYEALPPLRHPDLEGGNRRIFERMAKQDILLHFPYQRYDYVLRFLEQAAHDPRVREIRITQYRVAKDSQVIAALRSAVQAGKQVTVFVEVKARFDEEANLNWAERLEQWGVKVLYSMPDIKVHAKLLLISRQEGTEIKDYAYLSTGNFNESTSRIYGDFGFLTADTRITEEIRQLFHFLETGERPKQPFKHLLVGQFKMRHNFYQLIDNETKAALEGKHAAITLKMNSLQDLRIIDKLYTAARAGVKIKLIVRGICCMTPDLPEFKGNIEVRSIVDRFLEHARVHIFHNSGQELFYLSSADWMTRNLYHRIECAFPIYDPRLQTELREVFDLQWRDNVKARCLDAKQTNAYCHNDLPPHRAQYELYAHHQRQLPSKYRGE